MSDLGAHGELLGRTAEVDRISAAVRAAAAGRGASMWVEGESGIGKSVLVDAGLARAGDAGCVVLRGAAEPLSQPRPLAVLLECRRVRSGAGGPVEGSVAELLGGAGGNVVSTADTVAGSAHRLVELVESWCVRAPIVLVVDDLQWADETSLLVWRRLHLVARQAPLLLIGVCRPVPVRVEVNRVRDELVAGGGQLVVLDPLAPDHVARLVEGFVGAPPGPQLRELVGQAGGNPLYVRELVDALVRAGEIEVGGGVGELVAGAGAGARVPVSVAAAIEHRLGYLSEAATTMLRVAAVLGPKFSVGDLSLVSEYPAARLVPVVAEAVAAGVLTEAGDRLAFRHGLIRQVLYDRVPVPLRSAVHRQAAQALAGVGVPVVRVAGQLLAAAQVDAGEVADDWVVGWLADAGTALAYRAPRVAAELLGRVSEAADTGETRRDRLNAARARALHLLGRDEEIIAFAPTALADAAEPEAVAEVAWLLSYAYARSGRHREAIAVVTAALAHPNIPAGRAARLRALHALHLRWSGAEGRRDGRALARQAQADGARAGDRVAVAYALHAEAALCSSDRAGWQEKLVLYDRALTATTGLLEALDLRFLLLANRALGLEALERTADAGLALRAVVSAAERQAAPERLLQVRLQLADWLLFHGQWDDAVAELDAPEADEGNSLYRVMWHGQRAFVALHRDQRAELDRHLHLADQIDLDHAEHLMTGWYLLVARALAAEAEGRPGTASAELEVIFEHADDATYAGTTEHTFLWLPDAVRLALAVGKPASAERWAEAAKAHATADPSRSTRAVARHCSALVAADPAGVLEAADEYLAYEWSLFAAQARENAAVLYAAGGDVAAARGAYAEAVSTYTSLGADWDIRRGDARLRRYGIRRSGPRRRRPTRGWGALSPVELRVAALVAGGRSNPDIARELYLSAHTVRTHVSHILVKLDARSRVDIARQAEAHRLESPGSERIG